MSTKPLVQAVKANTTVAGRVTSMEIDERYNGYDKPKTEYTKYGVAIQDADLGVTGHLTLHSDKFTSARELTIGDEVKFVIVGLD